MSISTLESSQSRRMLDDIHVRQTAQYMAEAEMIYQFMIAINEGNPDATPPWTGTRPDFKKEREAGGNIDYDKPAERRPVTVSEALDEALDFGDGPNTGDIIRLLSVSMRSTDDFVKLLARALVRRCAEQYAKHNVAVDYE